MYPSQSLVPSLKVTVPVAVLGVTLALKVTDWPDVEVIGEIDSTRVLY